MTSRENDLTMFSHAIYVPDKLGKREESLLITQQLSFLGVNPKNGNWTSQEARNLNFDSGRIGTHDLRNIASFLYRMSNEDRRDHFHSN